MAQAQRDKNLYLNVKVRKDTAHIANSLEESAMLWHERLGHLNMASFKELDAMVDGMNLKEVSVASHLSRMHQRQTSKNIISQFTTFGDYPHRCV